MALNRISPLQFDLADAPFNFPSADGINALSLAQNVAESLTIPTGANVMKITATVDVWMKANGTASVPGDTTDGTASELIKYNGGTDAWRTLNGVTTLSFLTNNASGGIVSASFYTL